MMDLLFRLGFASLLTHEINAVGHGEWRVLPLTSLLPRRAFTAPNLLSGFPG